MQTCLEAGSTPSVPRPITAANEQLGLFSKEDCRYDQAPDTSQGLAGALRTCRFDTVAPGRPICSDATPAGGGCALTQPCTRRQGGRRMTRGGDAQLLEAREQRVRSRPEVMKQRQALVEHPCGTLKREGKGAFQGQRAFACTGTALQQRVLTQAGAWFGPEGTSCLFFTSGAICCGPYNSASVPASGSLNRR